MIGRLEDDQVVLDLRAVDAASDVLLTRALVAAYTRLQAIQDNGR